MIYDASSHNELPHIEHAEPASSQEILRLGSLAPLFKTNGIYRDVGIALRHRHFQLADGELIVWRLEENEVVSDVRKFGDDLLALSWSVATAGRLVPAEYVDRSSLPNRYLRLLESYQQNDERLNQVAKSLVFIGATDRFCISLMPILISAMRPRSDDGLRNISPTEISNEDIRSSVLSFRKYLGIPLIETLWVFQRGKLLVAGGNCSHVAPPPPP